MKLTDMVIKKAKPRDKAYSLADGKGLSLLIEYTGSKGWRFRYRFEGKAKMLSFGTYPEVTLLMAREKREAARKLLMDVMV
ncbi:Putative prophage CPS-53 integrase [Providencia rustigianii]|nr:Putative prophage CPS-53 integrase [Providencia rustigianii]